MRPSPPLALLSLSPSLFLPVLLLVLGSTEPASAHDWRAMRAEYAAELANARMMARLDCGGLNAYVEQQRWLTNQWINAESQRGLSRPTAGTTPTLPSTSPFFTPSQPR